MYAQKVSGFGIALFNTEEKWPCLLGQQMNLNNISSEMVNRNW